MTKTVIEPRPINIVSLPRCPKCGSTDRTKYRWMRRFRIQMTDKNGRPVNELIYKTCECTQCGQTRVDHFYGYRGKPRHVRRSSGDHDDDE